MISANAYFVSLYKQNNAFLQRVGCFSTYILKLLSAVWQILKIIRLSRLQNLTFYRIATIHKSFSTSIHRFCVKCGELVSEWNCRGHYSINREWWTSLALSLIGVGFWILTFIVKVQDDIIIFVTLDPLICVMPKQVWHLILYRTNNQRKQF